MKNGLIRIVAQAFYGNFTCTEIRPDDVDSFILGHQDSEMKISEPVDRTVVHLPGSDELVLVYNRYQEEKALQNKERAFREDGYVVRPLAVIPESDLEIYSRCIACRMNADGGFESIDRSDFSILSRYLAD